MIEFEPGIHELPPGVDVAEVRERAARAAMRFVHLDTSRVAGREDFFEVVAKAFSFPQWFGRNWDAFADSLADVRADPGIVIVWDGWHAFADADAAAFAVAVDVLRQRAANRLGGAFAVLVGKS
jgi:RNAse (barnase) inhibitor barstar